MPGFTYHGCGAAADLSGKERTAFPFHSVPAKPGTETEKQMQRWEIFGNLPILQRLELG